MNILFFLKPKNEVAVIYNDYSLRQVLETMEYHRYSSIPMLNRDGEYVGTITEGDLLWYIKDELSLNLREAEKLPVASVKRNRDYDCVRIDADIEDLIGKAKNQNFVPVVDDQNSFIGIVTRSDVIGHFYEKLAKEK